MRGPVRRNLSSPAALSVVALLSLAGTTALAVDGVIEINQADGPLFRIDAPGSYRLTSDIVRNGADGILIRSDHVTLDLNGFTVSSDGAGSGSDGIDIWAYHNIEIRNGTVQGFGRHGIFGALDSSNIRVIGVRTVGNNSSGILLAGPATLIDGCYALANGSNGFNAVEGSLVINSVARENGGYALWAPLNGVGYRSNVFTDNNGGDANPQVSGGIQLGGNFCGTNSICP